MQQHQMLLSLPIVDSTTHTEQSTLETYKLGYGDSCSDASVVTTTSNLETTPIFLIAPGC